MTVEQISAAERLVTVRPLVWDNEVMPPFERFSRTPFGTYRARVSRDRGNGWWLHFNGMMGDCFGTERECMDAAYIHYSTRILSAIIPAVQL